MRNLFLLALAIVCLGMTHVTLATADSNPPQLGSGSGDGGEGLAPEAPPPDVPPDDGNTDQPAQVPAPSNPNPSGAVPATTVPLAPLPAIAAEPARGLYCHVTGTVWTMADLLRDQENTDPQWSVLGPWRDAYYDPITGAGNCDQPEQRVLYCHLVDGKWRTANLLKGQQATDPHWVSQGPWKDAVTDSVHGGTSCDPLNTVVSSNTSTNQPAKAVIRTQLRKVAPRMVTVKPPDTVTSAKVVPAAKPVSKSGSAARRTSAVTKPVTPTKVKPKPQFVWVAPPPAD